MGHVRVYSISDTFAHYYRMRGYNVIHPMGWDAFGLPAENAAIDNGVSPAVWTRDNIAKMKEQLLELGCVFDWSRELATCDPSYYRWTQWMFLQLHKAGLVYRSEAMVNWDPVDQTVLADEQVDSEGRSWRSGAKVERKPLRQWFFKTTNFAKSLLDGLKDPSLVNWRHVVMAQENWIGDCSGTNIDFSVRVDGVATDHVLTVWTDKPEYLHAAQFILLHPDHLLSSAGGDMRAVCPLTSREIPVTVSDAVQYSRDCQTILGIPSIDSDHSDIVEKYKVNTASDVATNVIANDRDKVMEKLRELGVGGHETSSNLKDWLISRQRYWGTPIPIIHCDTCGPVPVPESQLPVELPSLSGDEMSAKGASPLLQCQEWVKTTCPECGGEARRETDTMDTFVDSSWYFLRYLDPLNDKEPFSQEAVASMPVDLYIGGLEHAYLHLYFARFFTHFLHSEGKVPVKEPFTSLITQGMVKGRSYRLKHSTKYLRPSEVYEEGGKWYQQDTGAPVVTDWEKMSKSKYNGVDPGLMFDQYGCDTVRLMMLCNVGPSSDRNWDEDTWPGIRNMQIKLFKLVHQAVELQRITLPEMRYDTEVEDYRAKLRQERNTHLRHILYNYNVTRNLAVVIARVNSLINAVWGVPGQVKRDTPEYQQMLGEILIILAPIAPHMVSELWASFCSVRDKHYTDFDYTKGVFHQQWPQLDQNFNLELNIRCNNQKSGKIQVAKWYFDTMTEEQAFDLCCHEPKLQDKWLKYDIVEKKFSKVEDFDATLDLTFDVQNAESTLTPEEKHKLKLERKEAQRQEKAARKAARAERIKIYEENIARKERISTTFENGRKSK